MKNKFLISIIMNCFNGEKYLKQSLDSIINQSYKKWELIFFDNQSSDNSKKILESYNDIRFKYYKSDNFLELAKARNKAIEKANGEYIAILDTDDFWHYKKIELQLQKFNNKIGVVFGLCQHINHNNEDRGLKVIDKNYCSNNFIKNYMTNQLISNSSVMISNSYLKQLNYVYDNQYNLIHDFDLNLRLAKICNFTFLDSVVTFRRQHESNYSNKDYSIQINEMYNWLKLNSNCYDNSLLKKFKNNIYVLEIIYNLKKKNYFISIKYFMKLSIYKKYNIIKNKILK